jgi:adenosine deaminase
MQRICRSFVCLTRASLVVAVLLAPLSAGGAYAQAAATTKVAGATRPSATRVAPDEKATASEQRAVRAFDAARAGKANALELEALLERMPKGGDLHMHLSGAVYAETFLKDAAAENLCVNLATNTLTANVGMAKDTPKGSPARPVCLDAAVPAANALQNQGMFDQLVDAWSMRSFVPTPGISGHDQFFATFDRFGHLHGHEGEWLDEVATRAAAQNEQYLEVMMTPPTMMTAAFKFGGQFGWPGGGPGFDPGSTGDATGTSKTDLAALRAQLLAAGLHTEVAAEQKAIDDDLDARNRIEHCGQPDAAPACKVKIRVIYQVLRAFPPQQVFVEALLGFEVAMADSNVVGLNFVQPEDNYTAMSEYHRQMLMMDYLHGVYPRVHISLHAGELAPGLVPPAGLRFHIREAVELGHADRIGHGVDVMYETDAAGLLREMAEKHVMVEINLTSNDVILGIVPPHHPLPDYRGAHVPVALSTDDEGVSRIDLTHEYVRAAMDFGLGYLDLKAMARTSLEHSFLPGDSLWEKPDMFTRVTAACSGQPMGAAMATADCLAFLKTSEKAAQQWELEHRLAVFEGSLE